MTEKSRTAQKSEIDSAIRTNSSGLITGPVLNIILKMMVDSMLSVLDDTDLAAIEALASTGIAVRSTTDTWVQRLVEVAAHQLAVTNPAGIAGNIQLAFASDVGLARKYGALCPHESLVVKYVSATSVDVDADGVVLFDSSGIGQRFASVNLTAAITSSGANGLDTGSEGSSRWYHIWCVGKEDGTLASLLSESATAPTLPSGYTFKGYVGAVYNNSSSDFVAFLQRGNRVSRKRTSVVAAGTQTSFTAIDLSAVVPSTAVSAIVDMQLLTVAAGNNAVQCRVAPAGSSTTATYGEVVSFHEYNTQAGGGMISPCFAVEMETAQQVVYRVAGTSPAANIQTQGYLF